VDSIYTSDAYSNGSKPMKTQNPPSSGPFKKPGINWKNPNAI